MVADRATDSEATRPRPSAGSSSGAAEIELDGLTFSLTHVARRGRAAGGRQRRPARHRQRRVLPRPPSHLAAAAGRCRGGADGSRRGALDPRGDGAAGRRAVQRITLKWWGGRCRFRRSSSGTAQVGRSSGNPRSCAGSARTSASSRSKSARRRSRRRSPPPAPAGARAPRRRHIARVRPPEGDRRGRAHEGSVDQAGDDRAARRRARGAARRTRRRVPHRRPRDAGLARRDPLRRPGAARRRGCGVRADDVTEFGELSCARGSWATCAAPTCCRCCWNAADWPLFGSRPTPFDGADGYPALLDLLR